MPNANYLKGVRKERKIVNKARSLGLISLRSAGSHSPIDVIVIDKHTKYIHLYQCKPDSMSENKKNALLEEHKELQGSYTVTFEVV